MFNITNIAKEFLFNKTIKSIIPFGDGHINQTFLVECSSKKFILRKINKNIFKAPLKVIENTIKTTEHIRKKLTLEGEKELEKKTITLIKSTQNKFYYIDKNQDFWCAMHYFENAHTVSYTSSPEISFNAAKAFGKFQRLLIDANPSDFSPTIDDFHNTSLRLQNLEHSINTGIPERISNSKLEIEYAMLNKHIVNKMEALLKNKKIPIRITHNDTKINNVMLDNKTNKGVCVIDLDTVMPGTVLYDFGDMVRTSATPAKEDEEDLKKIFIDENIFSALAKGYLSELKNILTTEEIKHLVYGAELIIFEQAIRFLTDYLNGDKYYKIKFPDHNLIRTKNQFALLNSLQSQKQNLEKIINNIISN